MASPISTGDNQNRSASRLNRHANDDLEPGTRNTDDRTIGLIHTWWRGDRLPPLSPVPGLTIASTDDLSLLNDLMGIDEHELRARFITRHQAWVAWMGDEPAGYGWVATQHAAIKPLGLTLTLTFRRDEQYR